jgi:signal transduction histidine kinase
VSGTRVLIADDQALVRDGFRSILERDPSLELVGEAATGAEAEELLDTLEAQVEQAVADIRRVVYGLRPPALDEFGLLRALQLQASQLGTTSPLVVTLDAPEGGLGKLPAAVEVAAYRIACEAMTNVVRHSGATECTVRFQLNGALELDVSDNGRGLPADHRAGVGVTGMRERADELGGRLTIDSDPRGTVVHVRLPVVEPA